MVDDGDDSGATGTVTGTDCEVVVVVVLLVSGAHSASTLSTGAEEVVTTVLEDEDDEGLSITVAGTVVHEVVVVDDGADSGATVSITVTGTDCEVVVVVVLLVLGAHSASTLSTGTGDVVTTVLDELGAVVVTGTDFVTVVVVLDGDDGWLSLLVTLVVLVSGAHSASTLSTGAADVVTTVLDELGAGVAATGTDFVTVVVVLDGDDGWLSLLVTLVVVVSGAHSASTLSTGAADVVTTVLDELGVAVTVTGTDSVTVVVVLDGDDGWLSLLVTLVLLVSGAHSASTL